MTRRQSPICCALSLQQNSLYRVFRSFTSEVMSLVEKYFPSELYAVLKLLDLEREATIMQITETAGVSHSFLLNVMPLLKHNGFVSVFPLTTDKRKKIVKLTEAGRCLLHALECYLEKLESP